MGDVRSWGTMRRRTFTCFLISLAGAAALVAGPVEDGLERRFQQVVRPFVNQHCVNCHGGNAPAAQFNLQSYQTLADVVREHPHWTLLMERLKAGDMPPKPMRQPDPEARRQVIDWVAAVRANEARKHAGDPGLVLARRLSNAEYNYTIQDLTGVDMRPAKEFPVDPANPEGFDNSGESLSMSPSLMNKYLQAAREVAGHMVLNPDGIAFAPHPMLVETDREKYTIQRIVRFYESQPTDYADYFLAAWQYKHRVALGQPTATLASVAVARKVSPKYLPRVWRALESTPEQVGPLAKVQTLWRALPAPKRGAKDEPREACVAMRDYVVRVRALIVNNYESPMVRGLSATSQPLMNWKLNLFAKKRYDFDRAALLVEGEPLPVVPDAPKRGTFFVRESYDVVARQALVKLIKARLADPEPLRVPAGERARYEAAFGRFAAVFPDAFYIRERGRFFPDLTQDTGRLLSAGFHNVMGYFRDDLPLREMILDERQTRELEKLWQEFDFIADHTIRTYTQYYFNQSGEILGNGRESGSERPADKPITAPEIIFGLRDQYLAKAASDPGNSPEAKDAIEAHFQFVNAAIRAIEKVRAESEPRHLDALLRFAARAYRRPLTAAERTDLLGYYRQMRDKSGLTHEEAVRDSIVSILMAPDFCYRIDLLDTRGPKTRAQPLSEYALASRLSYFLWSTMPDEKLLARAAAGQLRLPGVLLSETRRMLKDPRARRMATEFAGHWLDFRRFEEHNAVDRQRFPSFDNALRQAMFEEPVRLIEDVIRQDRSVLDLLYGRHTFVNGPLAKHYGMPEPANGEEWKRVEDANAYGRGGLLAMSVFLTQNAPGLRTSPVKRGYWVVRRVLGEAIPPPPASVPELPQDEAKAERPLREMLAMHRDNPSCAGCHARFDSMGLAFEGYGPVGERRDKDLAGRPVDAQAEFPDGSRGGGLEAVQTYIRAKREQDYLDNLCRKLLAYGLGRSLMLSDDITIGRMRARLTVAGNRFAPLVETIVTSPQFLHKRGAD
jgi:mono/diheme cytochrome c family protein